MTAGAAAANNIAVYDPTSGTWSRLGSGINDAALPVLALTTLPNGDLVAGGQFTAAGGVAANSIARWNGTSWSPLGSGMSSTRYPGVRALTTLPNGDLVAGGDFTTAGGVAANNIARWNGTSWSPLGLGVDGGVRALTTLPNGDLVAGGGFTTAGGVIANHIARWDGTSWSPLSTGIDNDVYALTTLPNGDVVAAGLFATAGGVAANDIARWNGTSWSRLGSGMNGPVYALTTLPNGDLVAGGQFWTAGGVAANNLARWNGTSWSPLGSGTNELTFALTTLPNGDVVAGGNFTTAGGVAANYIARWNGTSWSPLSTGMNSGVFALTTLPNGDLVAGGGFTTAGGVAANKIARWNGTSWSPLGSGMNGPVRALTALPNGDVVAGGEFTTAGGVPANMIARWNGTSWSPLSSGMSASGYYPVRALTTLPNGDVVVGGKFWAAGGVIANNIARWNGTSWSALGSDMDFHSSVYAVTALPNGDIVAGGDFTTLGGGTVNCIARWSGTSWSPLSTGMSVSYYPYVPRVSALTTLPNGDLVAGGFFSTAGGVAADMIARWDGTSWSPFSTGINWEVSALTTLPNGDIVAGGHFWGAGGVTASRIARWNGTSWSRFGSGMRGSIGVFPVLALTTLPNGDLVAGGEFLTAGGLVSAYVARLTTTCPATVMSTGTGCAGTGGPMVLSATSLPWLGGTYRCRCTGMAASSLSAAVLGFGPQNTPLSALHPAGGAGCNLLATTDEMTPLVPVAGAVTHQLALPSNSSLVGVVLHNQVLQAELDPTGNIAWFGSSNALVLTTGSY